MGLMYHGCLRICEVLKAVGNDHALKAENVNFIWENNKMVAVKLTLSSYKHGKEPFPFQIRATFNKYCPVAAIFEFCKLRGDKAGLLFVKENKKPVNRNFLVKYLKKWIVKLGLDSNLYNSHSFRIGRATDMARAGVPEQIIKATGRWKSEAYARYIRFDNFTLPPAV